MKERADKILGCKESYRHAKILLEIGEHYLNLKQFESSLEFLNKGGQIIKTIYGESHSLVQKFNQYMLLYQSFKQDNLEALSFDNLLLI